jgi:zinc protease
VADDAAQIGASVRTLTISDDSIIAIRTLKPNVDAALDLLSDVVLHPKFDPAELERIRKQRETDILQIQDDPMQLAIGVLLKSVYGPDHPYGYRDEGTTEATRAVNRDDLVKMWQNGFSPANAALVLTGDLTPAEARSLAEKYFGDWKGVSRRRGPPPVTAKTSRAIYLVDKPGAAQTFLLVANLGVPRSTPDYVPLEVMNNILGGLYSSRINNNLREEHGYTYGGFSFFLYRRGQGLFAAGGGMRSDATAPAVEEMFKEIERIRTAPPTIEELKLSKGAFSLSLAGLFESSEQTANTVGDLFTYDLPLDYYQQLPAKIDAVTAQDAQRMANTYLHPETSVVIGAGDRSKIEESLKKLAIGPVELRDADGNPVKAAAAAGQAH